MSRLINRLAGRVYGWFDSKEARSTSRPLPAKFNRKARLVLTDLEERAVPATFTVTNINDSGAGSLRQAIADANAATDTDSIVFDASFSTPKQISLFSGELLVSENVTITGPGAGLLTVTNQDGRAFNVNNAGTQIDVTISGLSITGCSASAAGSAIQFNNEKLTLDSIVVAGNTTSSGGGAISASTAGSILNVLNSAIVNNKSTGAGGGFNIASLTSGNTFLMRNSTVSGNSSSALGGGIYHSNTSALTTFSIFNSTITNNTATGGGGLRATSNAATVTLNSTIISGNAGPAASPDILSFKVNSTNSAIGNATGWTVGTSTNDVPIGAVLNLLALSGNGGGTFTHGIGSTASPLVNAGLNPNGETNDQRGAGFPRAVGTIDIGAFELDSTIPLATPGALTAVSDANKLALNPYSFTVTFQSGDDIDVTTLDDGDEVRITGPNGFNQLANFVSASPNTNATSILATYQFAAPGGSWDIADIRAYRISMEGGQVATIAPKRSRRARGVPGQSGDQLCGDEFERLWHGFAATGDHRRQHQ